MPQELRQPQFRTEKTSGLAIKLLTVDSIIRSQSIIAGGQFYQKMALDSCWPDRTREEEEMLVETAIEIDKVTKEYSEIYQQSNSDVKQNKVN